MQKLGKSFKIILLVVSLIFIISAIFPFINAMKVMADEPLTITVINCEDYIDEELLLTDGYEPDLENGETEEDRIKTFEQTYGVKVDYYTKGTNEEMYNELIKNPNGIDLLCVSEYMIMKMMTEGLIKSFNTPQNYVDYCSPYIKNVFKGLSVAGENESVIPIMTQDELTTYAVGYMWGTMGFVYNMEVYEEGELTNWSSILENEKSQGKITIKDSIRDSYIMALGAVYSEELQALDKNSADYNKKLTEIFNRCGDEDIDKVGDYLLELRKNIYNFEVDSGKTDILLKRIYANFAWSGDAVYAMDQGDDPLLVEDENYDKDNFVSLGYFVPEEGSNVWFDGWVMPKNVSGAREEAALNFINFMSAPENAIINMEYTGYTSTVGGEEVFDWLSGYYELPTFDENGVVILDEEQSIESPELIGKNIDYFINELGYTPVDLSYFFEGVPEGESIVYTDTLGRQLYGQYSDWETIRRCAVMDNFSVETLKKINDMWNEVKLVTLELWQIILIVVVMLVAVVCVICWKYREPIGCLCKKVFKKK